MKTMRLKIAGAAAMIVRVKKRTDLLIVQLTNSKTYTTVESIIISIAN